MKALLIFILLIGSAVLKPALSQCDSVFFDKNRASLNWNALQQLNHMAETYQKAPQKIVINAVTLESDDMFRARKLSLRRAQTAKDYLIAIGVDKAQIEVLEVLPNSTSEFAFVNDSGFLEIRK